MSKNVAKSKKKGEKKKKITPRQRKFVNFYIETGNATQSYIKAGYSKNGADRSSERLLRNANVADFYEKKKAELDAKLDFDLQNVLQELGKLAFSNSADFFDWDWKEVELIPDTGIMTKKGVALLKSPDQLTRDHKACIQSIKETRDGIELKLYSKQAALDSLKKHFGGDNEAEIRKAIAIKKGDTTDNNVTNVQERIKNRMEKLKNANN